MKTIIKCTLLISALTASVLNSYVKDEGYKFLEQAFCPTGHVDRDLEPGSEAREDFEEIRQNSVPWCSFFGFSPSKQDALNAIQNFVYSRSYTYAFNRTQNNNLANFIATTIKNDFDSETKKYYDKFNPRSGAYREFIGNGLHNKVDQALKKQNYNQHPLPPAYPHAIDRTDYRPDQKRTHQASKTDLPDPCGICYDEFRDTQERVYLPKENRTEKQGSYEKYKTCCGKWACTTCVERWFFKENKSHCPFCRQAVGRQLLENILATKKR